MAEHRQLQQAALLDAARVLLAEGGREALSFGALAARTGLARSSVYEYFRSKSELVEALCTVDLPLWAAEVEAGMAVRDSAVERIEAYVRGQVSLATDPLHRAVVAVAEHELDDAARARIRAAHAGLTAMVVSTLEDLGHDRPGVAASLLQGVVEAAVRQAERIRGEDAAAVAEAVREIADTAVRFALDGLRPADRGGERPADRGGERPAGAGGPAGR
ncbi:TetR/AcrR family transcriptional regulator [Kitasatospora phosalacinea]|uniref:TetR/AcrR family transcriptional regulator n=1 Tax=Kitasatospora phosalacinea TaxID=2065 RepID=UPI000525BD12|nr:TetR/AcrR family transcriptional regulator [Kitasatospora phosalacinea]